MHLIIKGIVLILLPLLFICTTKGVASDSLETDIDNILKQYIGKYTPGATIGIIDNGVLVFQKGYGMANLRKQLINGPAAVYKIASLSKQFTAAAVISLVRENKLLLSDNIRQYVPSFPDYGKPVTIGDLLYHTSGIRDYMVLMWLGGKSFETRFSNRDALEIIKRQSALNFTTGYRCVYSNSNYLLLAEVIRQVSGMQLNEYADKVLFSKLNMDSTGFGPAKIPFAQSYGRNDMNYFAYKNDFAAIGDGGMFTTLEDLAAWDRTFYDSTSLAHHLLQRGRLENGNLLNYGMGIMMGNYRSEPVQSHPGAFLGYRSEMLRFPNKKITIICLANTEEINPEAIARRIADAYLFKDRINVSAPLPVVINHTALAGKYEVTPNVFIGINWRNGTLTGQLTGHPPQTLYQLEGDTFQIGQTEDKAIFSEERKGLMWQLTIQQRQGNAVAKRLELVTGEMLKNYEGVYHSSEQGTSYKFFIRGGDLWFTVGKNPKEKAEIMMKLNKLYFSYKGLETATIDFSRDETGRVSGFMLSSGRLTGIKFVKI